MEGVKLDLGSTAKLRTLITYLEIIASLHDLYADLSRAELNRLRVAPEDKLSKWAISFFQETGDKSLLAELRFRPPWNATYFRKSLEAFFTGGGLHTFANFAKADNDRTFSVRNGFKNSVNLVFIRLMRDIVHYYRFNEQSGSANLPRSPDDPLRSSLPEEICRL